jgi:HEAT repeat protein
MHCLNSLPNRGHKWQISILALLILTPWFWIGCGDSRVNRFINDLKDPDFRVRAAAADSLGLIGSKKAVQPLVKALKDRHYQVQDAAADALARIGSPSVEPLLPMLEYVKPEVRIKAVYALGKIGDKRAVEPLLSMLDDRKIDVQIEAVEALGNIGAESSVAPLIDLLKAENRQIRDAAADALVKSGKVAVESLIKLLEDHESQLRPNAAELLGLIRDPHAVEPLISALHDQQDDVRWQAAQALGRIRDDRAVEPLITALGKEKGWLRSEIAKALGEIGNPHAVQPLIALFREKDNDTRCVAAQALGKIGDQRAVPVLVPSLRDWRVNAVIVDVLEKLGWKPQSVEDRVHVLTAKKDAKSLLRIWNNTRQVLLNDMRTDIYHIIENSVYAFIAIGKEEALGDLVHLLNESGTQNMAQVYVNCGLGSLSVFAKDWAHRKGHDVFHTGNPPPVTWGEWK